MSSCGTSVSGLLACWVRLKTRVIDGLTGMSTNSAFWSSCKTDSVRSFVGVDYLPLIT